MVLISEWLPNPVGNDATGEWVELFNNGNVAVNLSGWTPKTKGGDKFAVKSQSVGAGDYLVLPRTATGLVLKNTNEALYLYDSGGKLADQSEYLGSAPEGKSFAKIDYGSSNFVFTDPTPGAQNKFAAVNVENLYPYGQPLNPGLATWDIVGLALGTAAVLAGIMLYAVKKNENLSKLFFGGDEEIR